MLKTRTPFEEVIKNGEPSPAAFNAIDGRLIRIQLVYCAVNIIASAFFRLGLNAFFTKELCEFLSLVVLFSTLLGPIVAVLAVVTIPVYCRCTDQVMPNSLTSCLMLGVSIFVMIFNLRVYPGLLDGV